MHIKQSKTERAERVRKAPDHVALIFAQGGGSARPDSGNKPGGSGVFLKNLIETAQQFGVRFLTFCCLEESGERDRPAPGGDLKILSHLLLEEQDWLAQNGVGVQFLEGEAGARPFASSRLNVSVISQMNGRTSIIGAVRALAREVELGKITSNDITSSRLDERISPCGLPDPDLLIFTGGLKRLENSLIWQSAYSEFAFAGESWENLTGEHFRRLLENYLTRDRRFGGLTGQTLNAAGSG